MRCCRARGGLFWEVDTHWPKLVSSLVSLLCHPLLFTRSHYRSLPSVVFQDNCITHYIPGPVVWMPVSANPGLNFNPGFFFFLSKALSRIIFSILFRVSNHQIVDKENLTELAFKLQHLSSNFTLTLGYPNPVPNNPAQVYKLIEWWFARLVYSIKTKARCSINHKQSHNQQPRSQIAPLRPAQKLPRIYSLRKTKNF